MHQIAPRQPDTPLAAADALRFDATLLAGQLAPSSIAMYQRDLRAYLEFADSAALAALDATTLRHWRAQLANATTLSPNTINRMLSAVKRIMREAAGQGYLADATALDFQQVEGVRAAALKTRIKPNARTRIEPVEMRRMCQLPRTDTLIGTRDAALLATLASGALRASELVNLQYRDIHAVGNAYIVTVLGKNDVEARQAPISREAVALIERWLAARRQALEEGSASVRLQEGQDQGFGDDGFIFTAFEGKGNRLAAGPITTTALWQIVRNYAAEAGIADVKPHDFRRFVGTQLARKDIRQAQKALGHKRLETTARHYVLDELDSGLTDHLY